jgi:carbon storage regulator CsrA
MEDFSMLVLTLRPGEGATIGDNVRVSVQQVAGQKVRVGFELPDEVAVERDEVRERSLAINQQLQRKGNVTQCPIST